MTTMTAKHLRALIAKNGRLDEGLALVALEDNCLWYVTGPEGQETVSVGFTADRAVQWAVEDPCTGGVKGDLAAYAATRITGVTAGG